MIEGGTRVACRPPVFFGNGILQNRKLARLAPVTRNLSPAHHHFVADGVSMQPQIQSLCDGDEMNSLDFPEYTYRERLADGIIHLIGVTAAIVGAIILLVMATDTLSGASALSLTVYSFGLVAVFCFSAAYHLTGGSPLKALLKRFDQAAIYFKIASTYTPIMVINLVGWPGTGLLALIWSVATFGMTTKLFFPHRLVRTSYVLYLVLGWCAVLIFAPLVDALSMQTLMLILVGGILYTVGVVFHLWPGLRYQNAIWHTFVLGGAGCHYAAIMSSVALA
tara:strand:- start:9632 stop:10468 length:837 start_codon:yes stop_codon:yes gene_type:complete